MATVAASLSAEEFSKLDEVGFRLELVSGEVLKMSPAGQAHGRIAMRFGWRLAKFVEEAKLGAVFAAETGFLLQTNPDTVRAPDVAFVSAERLARAANEGFFPGAPDLAVEVISPSDSWTAVESKVFDWLDAGSRAVLVLDPRRNDVGVYRSRRDIRFLSSGEVLSLEDLIPGWSLEVDAIFE